jgi:hypothetical protein
MNPKWGDLISKGNLQQLLENLLGQLAITLSPWAVILVRFQDNKDVSANQRKHSARLHLSQPA